jgi:hypothetical protein
MKTGMAGGLIAGLLAAPMAMAADAPLGTIPVKAVELKDKMLKVGEVSIEYGGFIKLDALLSHFSDGDVGSLDAGRDYFRPNSIPVAAQEDGRVFLDLHAKDTRFTFKMKSHVKGAELGGYLEFDFRSSPGGNEVSTNSYNPRIRRAFLTYDHWLFGQEWSLMRNSEASPDHIDDLRGPTQALVIVRQAQVRYTHGPFQVALENPETNLQPFRGTVSGTTPVRTPFVTGDSRVPDLTLRYNLKSSIGNFSTTLLARELVADNAGTGGDAPNSVAHGTAFGYGINVAGKVPLAGQDDLRFSLTAGDGIGRYLGLATLADAVVAEDYGLETIRASGGYVSYRHPWSETWRSNLTVAGLLADQDVDLTGTTVTKSVMSAHVNLLYTPIDKLTFGVEFMHAIREIESGNDGTMSRLQFSAKYEW